MTVKKKRICVYCGSRTGQNPVYEAMARELGEKLVNSQIDLVYGGGRVGLMGVVSRTVMEKGGEVYGVIPRGLFGQEVADTEITELKVVGSMHERKALMEELSDAFIAIPGGWGTLDEFFEILTWAQIGIHRKPILLLNYHGFFEGLIGQTQHMIQEGFVAPQNLELLTVVATVDEAMDKFKEIFSGKKL